jgi:hypothetical protein
LCMKEWASAEFAYAEPSIFFTVSEDTGTWTKNSFATVLYNTLHLPNQPVSLYVFSTRTQRNMLLPSS